ncbi:MAG: hypothetical protein NVS1B10_01970 [Candidatus Saccharimonadales bacterium]
MIVSPSKSTWQGIKKSSHYIPKDIRELQRLAHLGRLSASLLHEITTPLTAALLNLELNKHHSAGIRQAQRDMMILRRYVEAARQQIKQRSNDRLFYVYPQIVQIKRILKPIAIGTEVRLEINCKESIRIKGDPVKFQQIVANLTINAIQAYNLGDSDKQSRYVHVSLVKVGRWLKIEVKDWGVGIQDKYLQKIFDPFYTTKAKSNHGLGIGLAIVKQYVQTDFKGTIKVTSSPLNGTCFTIKIPYC